MSPKTRSLLLALAGTMLVPGAASAASAIATTDVNLRAGPSTAYPPVNVVGSGSEVEVFGCLSNRSWCDVDYFGQRGWMSSHYLAYLQDGNRYTGPQSIGYIGAPVVSFSFGNYWDDHYRGRNFYRDRRRYDGIYGPRIFDGPPPYEVRDRRNYDGPRRAERRDRFEERRERFEERRERFERRRDRFEDGPRRDRLDRGAPVYFDEGRGGRDY